MTHITQPPKLLQCKKDTAKTTAITPGWTSAKR